MAVTTSYWFDINSTTDGYVTPSTNPLTGLWGTVGAANWNTAQAGTNATVNFPTAAPAGYGAYFGSSTVQIAGGQATILTGTTIGLNEIGIQNSTAAYTVAALGTGQITFSGTTAQINVAANATGGLTISAPMGGTVAVSKVGAGTLTLSGTNTFSGSTFTLSVGQITIGNASAFGSHTFTVTGGVTLDVTAASAFTIANAMIITTGFTFAGTSSLGISGATGINGLTTIAVSANTLSMQGLLSNFGASTGSITVTSAGSGVLELTNGASTFTGGVTLTSGTLRVGASSTGAVGAVTSGPVGTNTIVFGAGAIDASTTATLNNAIGWVNTGSSLTFSGTSALTLGGNIPLGTTRTITTNGSAALTLSGNISGATFGITKAGTGTLTLSGTNSSMTGAVSLNAGRLNVNSATALGSVASTFTIAVGTTLDNTSGALVTLSANQPVTVGGNFTWVGTRNLTLGTGNVTLAAVRTVSGVNSIDWPLTFGGTVQAGTGGWVVVGTYLSLGGTNLNTGKNVIGDVGGSLAPSRLNVTANNALGATPASPVADQLTIYGGGYFTASTSVTLPANFGITVSGATNIGATAGTFIINGIIAGTGRITLPALYNVGTTTFAGANTFSGSLTINSGTLNVTNASGLGSNTARAITVASGAAISTGAAVSGSNLSTEINGTGITTLGAVILGSGTGNADLGAITLGSSASIRASVAANLLSSILTASGRNLTLQATSGNNGQFIGAITGAGNLIAGGTANGVNQTGNVTLTSTANNYTGTTTVSTGILTVTGRLGLGSYTGNISIASGAIFDYNSSSNQTLSGTISGAGALRRGNSGVGVLAITGTNDYTGTTSIFFSTISVPVLTTSATPQPLGTNTTINIGLTNLAGTLRYTGTGDTTNKVINLAGTTGGAVISHTGSGTLTFTSNLTTSGSGTKTLSFTGTVAPIVIGGIIPDSVGGATVLTYGGTSTLTLTAANTYTGLTTVSTSGAGVLDISAGNDRLNPAGSITLSGGTIALGTANQTTTTLTLGTGSISSAITGSGTLTATTLTVSATGGTYTVSTPLVVSGAMTKTASSSLILNGSNSFNTVSLTSGPTTFGSSNTFSGAFQMSNASVTFSGANTFSSTFSVAGGVTFNAANNFGGLPLITLTGSSTFTTTISGITLSQDIDLGGNATFSLPTAATTLTLSGALTGASTITLGFSATTTGSSSVLFLTNTGNTFAGAVTVRNGAVYITDVAQLGSGSKTIAIAATTTGAAGFVLDGTSANITLPSTFSFQTSSGTGVSPEPTYFGVVNVAGDNEIQGTVSMAPGGGDSYFTVTGGTLTLSGTVTASAGTRRLQLRGTTSGTVSGVINNTNTPAVTVSGSATWTFTNTNTYAGGTIITGTSTAVAANVAAFGAGNVTMGASTATIKSLTAGGQNGKLTIGGNFDNSAGATIRIGT